MALKTLFPHAEDVITHALSVLMLTGTLTRRPFTLRRSMVDNAAESLPKWCPDCNQSFGPDNCTDDPDNSDDIGVVACGCGHRLLISTEDCQTIVGQGLSCTAING